MLLLLCLHNLGLSPNYHLFAYSFLDYYFGIMLNRENTSYLYQVGNEVKQTRDRTDPKSVNIYVVVDLAQMMIQRKCAAQGWPLQSFSGKLSLPNLFVKIDNVDEANAVLRKNHVPAALRKANMIAGNNTSK